MNSFPEKTATPNTNMKYHVTLIHK